MDVTYTGDGKMSIAFVSNKRTCLVFAWPERSPKAQCIHVKIDNVDFWLNSNQAIKLSETLKDIVRWHNENLKVK